MTVCKRNISVCPPTLLDDRAELLQLTLRPEHRAEPLLGQFPCLFVLGVPQQLHHSSLIRTESSNLADDRPHELVFGRRNTLPLARAGGLGNRGRGVPLVEATSGVVTNHDLHWSTLA